MAAPRPNRAKNPSTKLVADNSEPPLLTSHRQNIANAEAAAAAAAALAAASTAAGPEPPVVQRVPETSTSSNPATSTSSNHAFSATPRVDLTTSQRTSSTSALQLDSTTSTNKRKDNPGETDGEVDKTGLYKDVDILDIEDSDEEKRRTENKNPRKDLDHFFEASKAPSGGDKNPRRLCKLCK
ncbi:hypothetical protein FPV67DRAFT_1445441 [Lyophyllum atratum]|nr:hypothetical protein FPV67DRAFT_1445441 [Lyophyllum atratum]